MKGLQGYLPFLPKNAVIISENLALVRDEDQMVFYNASGSIYSCSENDKDAIRIAQAMFVELKITRPKALAKTLRVNQSTVHRNRKKYKEGGVEAFKGKKRQRAPYAFKGENRIKGQEYLDKGVTIRTTAKKLEVSEGAIRYAIKKGILKREDSTNNLKSPSERSKQDQCGDGGIGVKRNNERNQAMLGILYEASPLFVPVEGVQKAGVLLALPVLLSQGLLEAGKDVYGSLKNGFFGLQSVLLILAFMALLRVKTPEQLKGHAPGELGIILGLDRAPEVKTLRRKLKEMGEYGKATVFSASLTQRWASEKPSSLGFLYVDGHVRAYNGRKHKLPKTHVARRRLCMPATTDFWVNDANTEPLFVVTAEANDSLLSMLDNKILPEVRRIVGEYRRVTVCFDREGWSPKLFEKWSSEGFDVLTYRKGNYDPWPLECFFEVEGEVCGKTVKYKLGQRSVQLRKNFWMREVRRLCENGHQTSVMSTRQDIPMEEIAHRMFFRWTQENFFRYMRHEYDIDHLCTYSVEQADIDRLVPNPAKKEKKKEFERIKRELEKYKKEYGEAALENSESLRRTMRGFKIANSEHGKRIHELEKKCQETETAMKALPERVPLKEFVKEEEIVKLELERKILTDAIKMTSYRAKTSLFNLIQPFFMRHEDEGRMFLKSLFQLTGDILPDEENGRLVIHFHTMANQRSNNVIKALCEIINQEGCVYPGTSLRLTFKAP